MTRRIRRTDCLRGRTLDALDIVMPSQRRNRDVHTYLSAGTHAEIRRVATSLGITMGGLVALLIEGGGDLELRARGLLLRAPRQAQPNGRDHHAR